MFDWFAEHGVSSSSFGPLDQRQQDDNVVLQQEFTNFPDLVFILYPGKPLSRLEWKEERTNIFLAALEWKIVKDRVLKT